MKVAIALISVLFVSCVYAGPELDEILMNTRECLKEIDADLGELLINPHKLGCLQACIGKRMKFMKGNKFDLKSLDQHMQALNGELTELTIECAKNVNQHPPQDECDSNLELGACLMGKLQSGFLLS